MVGVAEEAREMLLANHSIRFQTQNLGTLFSMAFEEKYSSPALDLTCTSVGEVIKMYPQGKPYHRGLR